MSCCPPYTFFFFFFNDTATTEIYTLSLHDALPISPSRWSRTPRTPPVHTGPAGCRPPQHPTTLRGSRAGPPPWSRPARSEEHTSELQSQSNLVCRLLLEKKKKNNYKHTYTASVRTC